MSGTVCLPTCRRLRSSVRGDFVVRRTRTRLANSSFTVAGLATWKLLPVSIRNTNSHAAFCRQLKIYLFSTPDWLPYLCSPHCVYSVLSVRRCWAPVKWRHSKLLWWWWRWWWWWILVLLTLLKAVLLSALILHSFLDGVCDLFWAAVRAFSLACSADYCFYSNVLWYYIYCHFWQNKRERELAKPNVFITTRYKVKELT